MTDIEILKLIVTKINNRTDINLFSSFDELIQRVTKTSSSKSTFLNDEEIAWVKKRPKIEKNIIKICRKVSDQEEKDRENYNSTIEKIIGDLELGRGTRSEPRKTIQYLCNVEKFSLVSNTIDEILINLDLSLLPYE
jgi:hypothetical protein